MNVYVAGKFSQRTLILKKMEELETMGLQITFKWPIYIDMSLVEAAEKEIQGVQACDLLIVLMLDKTHDYRGTFTEIGCALALNKAIFIINDLEEYERFEEKEELKGYYESNCFYHHPRLFHCKSWTHCLNLITLRIP